MIIFILGIIFAVAGFVVTPAINAYGSSSGMASFPVLSSAPTPAT